MVREEKQKKNQKCKMSWGQVKEINKNYGLKEKWIRKRADHGSAASKLKSCK